MIINLNLLMPQNQIGHDRIGISPLWMGPWRQCLCKGTFMNSAIDEYLGSPAVVPCKQRKFKTLTCMYLLNSRLRRAMSARSSVSQPAELMGKDERDVGNLRPDKLIQEEGLEEGKVRGFIQTRCRVDMQTIYYTNNVLCKQHIM